ncbi:MAG: UDP-glucose/iron transport system ATP-binding protein [Petroclostridium sp.]|jgi:putative ABC transport system ATP-binding protein|nr:transporter ATP-binding protein [Clostridia bacterium]MDK2810805.1 UDP-glucose/iron transport system ATP-binding protein [Petroclostridium sp.]
MYTFQNITYKNVLDIGNLEIKEHKITCLVGESGSGKTTLLRLLNHMISPDNGTIKFKGEYIHKIDPIQLRRNVVMLPQTPVTFPGDIKRNLLIGLEFSEKPTVSDEKLIEALKTVYLNKELNNEADKLSGGEKQRLALARILLLEPEVLLLDEPSSALDEETEKIVIEQVVKYVRKNKKTLIMVTHSKKVARDYADIIITINKGKVQNIEEVQQDEHNH